MMKNKIMLVSFLLFLMVCLLTGCQKSNFSMESDENKVRISAENAPKGFWGGSGPITVEEGQEIVVETDLQGKSEIKLKFSLMSALDGNSSAAEVINAVSGENADLEIVVSGNNTGRYEAEPGDYSVQVEALQKASGTILIQVR